MGDGAKALAMVWDRNDENVNYRGEDNKNGEERGVREMNSS